MNTELNYHIDYGTLAVKPPVPAPDPRAPMYASEDGVVASLSNNECIFRVKRTGETHVMTFQVLQALDQSREFRTVDEHIARILATIPGLERQREGVRRVLDSLIARGLLTADSAFLERIGKAAAHAAPAPLRAVFIRACDRPAQLEALLRSLTDYERRFRADRHYVLIDDSRTVAAVNRHRDLLREFARATGCKLTYIGAAERERLIERLGRGVPGAAAVLSWLFGGGGTDRFGGGRGWNLALLLSAGARFALLDDDHRLPLRRPAGARAGLDPNPTASAWTGFYRNLENALAAGEEVDGDPFELHLAAAGHRLGDLVVQPDYAVDRMALRGLSLSRLDHLHADACILATHQGAYGSSRTESGAWLYQLPPESRAEFVRDRDSYLRNIEAGSIWYGQRQAWAGTAGTFTPFMLDNSSLLPCTNPVGRGEDSLFSRTTELLHPESLMLELPVAVGHVQEGPRKRSDKTVSALTPRFNYFVADFMRRALPEFNAAAPAQRLGLLAAHLRDIGAASDKGCQRHLEEYLTYARADLIERMQQQYEAAADAPVYWQADVRSIIEANGRALTSSAPPRLGDWPVDADANDCVRLLREETAALAAAWEAWPALWEHARELGPKLLAAV